MSNLLHRLRGQAARTRVAELEHRVTALTNDRDTLLAVVGDFVDAIEHRPDRLDYVAHQARQAIDGRPTWTRAS
jgi:hypothetical protein